MKSTLNYIFKIAQFKNKFKNSIGVSKREATYYNSNVNEYLSICK